jgi:hypothetical protein
MPNRTLEGLDEEEKEEKEVAVVVVRKEDSYGPCPHLRDSEHSLNLAPNQENVSQCLILASFGYSSVQSAVVDNRQVNGCTFSRCDGVHQRFEHLQDAAPQILSHCFAQKSVGTCTEQQSWAIYPPAITFFTCASCVHGL